MPGVLVHDTDHIHNDSRSNSLKRSSSSGKGRTKSIEDKDSGKMAVNGTGQPHTGALTNGVSAGYTKSSEHAVGAKDISDDGLPEEMRRMTDGYVPLSRLVTRLVQETFNDLSVVINEMADREVPHTANNSGANHNHNHVNGDIQNNTSQANVYKKLRILDFAQAKRAQFIKILVLLQWSRRVEEIGRVIDLKAWLDSQGRILNDATAWIGELKRTLGPAQMPNPDLRTSLEILSSGKASCLPRLGYIPPEALTPQQLMKVLRNINTILSIRLNSTELIPQPLKIISIASGRATFHVPEEFEVDLSIADEDPASQLYFIDFRFLFIPSSTAIPAGRLRNEFEGKVDDVLRKQGLQGCYDFLHSLVLTHKLSILRNQAGEMVRKLWFENIRVDAVHRSLVVQYWSNRPGKKSWIEIGIKSGTRRDGSQRPNLGTPYIALRWMRAGQEIVDSKLQISLDRLSMESLLKHVIANHTNHILGEFKRKLRGSTLYRGRTLTISQDASITEPTSCKLRVQFTASKTIVITQEPISGAFALTPASQMTVRTEHELNNLSLPAADGPKRIATLRCLAVQEEVEAFAKCVSWDLMKAFVLSQETIKRLFPPHVSRISLFRLPAWSSTWLLAFTSSMSGDGWWVVEMLDLSAEISKSTPHSRLEQDLKSAFQIDTEGSAFPSKNLSHAFLSHIERNAAGMISQLVDTRFLVRHNIGHSLQSSSTYPTTPFPAVYLHFESSSKISQTIQPPAHESETWIQRVIKLEFQGLDPITSQVTHVASANMHLSIPKIRSLTFKIDPSLTFHPSNGSFAFRIDSSVGTSTIPLILDRLKRIDRLIIFVGIIKRYHFRCDKVSLDRLLFTYTPAPESLQADVTYTPNTQMQIRFKKGNPHLRIAGFLTNQFNEDGNLQNIALHLSTTLPLLRALTAIESAHGNGEVHVLPRSAQWYQIRYSLKHIRFDIRLKRRRDHVFWYLQDGSSRDVERSDALRQQMKMLFDGPGDGWDGKKTGIAATVSGVERLLMHIDVVIGGFNTPGLIATGADAETKGGEIKKEDEGSNEAVVVLD